MLGFELRKKDAPHNCVDDACAAMKLVLAKLKRGSDNGIPVAQNDVSPRDTNHMLLLCLQKLNTISYRYQRVKMQSCLYTGFQRTCQAKN